MKPENKQLSLSLLNTLFRVCVVSWLVFFACEYLWTGFVSNYFNVHWLLLGAVGLGVVVVLIPEEVY